MPIAGVADLHDRATVAALLGDDLGSPRYLYCGRRNVSLRLPASKWANPHRLADYTLEEAWALYREHIATTPQLRDALHELDGLILVCWCTSWLGVKPYDGERCHCDVLADLRAEQVRHA